MIQSKHQYNGKINYMSSANEFCFTRKKMNFVLQMNVNKIIYNSIIMLLYVRDKVFPVLKWTLIEPLVIASCFAHSTVLYHFVYYTPSFHISRRKLYMQISDN
jgi:hypothetical protein